MLCSSLLLQGRRFCYLSSRTAHRVSRASRWISCARCSPRYRLSSSIGLLVAYPRRSLARLRIFIAATACKGAVSAAVAVTVAAITYGEGTMGAAGGERADMTCRQIWPTPLIRSRTSRSAPQPLRSLRWTHRPERRAFCTCYSSSAPLLLAKAQYRGMVLCGVRRAWQRSPPLRRKYFAQFHHMKTMLPQSILCGGFSCVNGLQRTLSHRLLRMVSRCSVRSLPPALPCR